MQETISPFNLSLFVLNFVLLASFIGKQEKSEATNNELFFFSEYFYYLIPLSSQFP